VGNVCVLPLAGGVVKQITNFKSEMIIDFGWSSDGKRLAVLRYERSSDIILLHQTATHKNSSGQTS
jgi:hypothetical protein